MSKSRLAPTTSVRPKPRPADLGQDAARSQDPISALAPDRCPRPRPRPDDLWTPSSPGMYPGMGTKDETDEFGALGNGLKAAAAPGDAIAAMEATLAEQEANFAAVEADATIQEENALEGEAILGEPGPATAREGRRVAFWDNFYANMAQIDAALGQ